eukprot:m.95723 g.95723  ORF g.95723 m.95723 type:complete len:92 (-) comp12339_c0_seq1:1155-1430(-)
MCNSESPATSSLKRTGSIFLYFSRNLAFVSRALSMPSAFLTILVLMADSPSGAARALIFIKDSASLSVISRPSNIPCKMSLQSHFYDYEDR